MNEEIWDEAVEKEHIMRNELMEFVKKYHG
jgi:hypothetical protein